MGRSLRILSYWRFLYRASWRTATKNYSYQHFLLLLKFPHNPLYQFLTVISRISNGLYMKCSTLYPKPYLDCILDRGMHVQTSTDLNYLADVSKQRRNTFYTGHRVHKQTYYGLPPSSESFLKTRHIHPRGLPAYKLATLLCGLSLPKLLSCKIKWLSP